MVQQIATAIASRDSRPEEGASRMQRVNALALLPRERSPARALRWGIPRGIARSNHPTPSDRTNSLLERGSQRRPARRQEFQDLAIRRCSRLPEYRMVLFAAKSMFLPRLIPQLCKGAWLRRSFTLSTSYHKPVTMHELSSCLPRRLACHAVVGRRQVTP